jgi:murein DD-endopeptidase MepM/ murein hydrolase activator NlpD
MNHASIAMLLGCLLVLESASAACVRESFDMRVPVAPTPVAIDGREWLIYELHLTNFTLERLRLQGLDVLDQAGAVLHSYKEKEIVAQLAAPPFAAAVDSPVVQPGRRAITYLEVSLPPGKQVASLIHRVEYGGTGDADVCEVTGEAVRVQAPARLALGPPLRGGPWVAIYQWQWPRGHRRVFYTLDGRARLPGRFAIDWVKVDEQGRQARGDAEVASNALGYGVDVLAVADARVADVRDNVPESARVPDNPRHPLSEAAGNFVALELADGRFAVYEHLKPGSLRVKRGDRVHRGQVLASLGFTGDSTGPHLHFHVADTATPLAAEGVPFVFESFQVLGRYEDLEKLGSAPWVESGSQPRQRTRERPGPNAVLMFDDNR